MSDHPRKSLKELSNLLDRHGITVLSCEFAGKHRKLYVSNGVKQGMVTISITPSRRANLNVLATCRQVLREAP